MGGASWLGQSRLIFKREVWEAYKRVRANQGTAGVDEQSIADFEADLTSNLYKLWNLRCRAAIIRRRCVGLTSQKAKEAKRGRWDPHGR